MNEDLEGLIAELDGGTVATQFHPVRVDFKDTETPSPDRACRRRHSFTPLVAPVGKFSTNFSSPNIIEPKKKRTR